MQSEALRAEEAGCLDKKNPWHVELLKSREHEAQYFKNNLEAIKNERVESLKREQELRAIDMTTQKNKDAIEEFLLQIKEEEK